MIVSDKILSKEVEADQLKVTLHYTVIENIAEPQPISESDIQGDWVMAEQLVEMNQQLENTNEAIALLESMMLIWK